jgi:syntaxin 18
MQTQIPAQELQQLQEEQASLLEKLKAETLDTVTQIESSMMDVASMVREIGVQLSMQNENITILDSQKDEILGNVKSGNTVLVKANESNARRNRVFAWMIFFAAMLLLLIDYIL